MKKTFKKINLRGQFFSPDMIIAIFIFVVAISFFFISSENINQQISVLEERKRIDEVAHSTMNFLLYSPGIPSNWESKEFSDVNFFGLVTERNKISQEKINSFVSFFNNNYDDSKKKLGLRGFDLKLSVIDSQNNVIFSAGQEKSNPYKVLYYDKIAYYLDEIVIVRGEFYYDN